MAYVSGIAAIKNLRLTHSSSLRQYKFLATPKSNKLKVKSCAIEELKRMTLEHSDVLEEMNDKLLACVLQLVLMYFSQEGRDFWCTLEVFEWLQKENRVDKETIELMVPIMCSRMQRGTTTKIQKH
ncbi:Pentatricopeptide repeat-containing protein [Abeliophyllum distichum]|uniref:Pentatricopeptide repeat-containing protein n=1 Tax=Abeliophyllum distichum TaxID=126358 RepID=A0ABD1V2H6_9LAMI